LGCVRASADPDKKADNKRRRRRASDPMRLRIKLKGFERDISCFQEAVSALAIIQLGRARPPDLRLIAALAKNPVSDDQRKIKTLLQQLNRQRVPDDALDDMSATVHLACVWATIYRSTSGMNRARSNRRVRLLACEKAGGPKRELQQLARVAFGPQDLATYAKTVAALSPFAFDILQRAARATRITLETAPHLLCRACVGQAATAAIQKIALGHRPPMPAHDEAVRTVIQAYEALTGEAATRATRAVSNCADAKPMGELHALLLDVSNLYQLPLVSPDSDKRLRKRL
jgi:hypothetical protein